MTNRFSIMGTAIALGDLEHGLYSGINGLRNLPRSSEQVSEHRLNKCRFCLSSIGVH